MTAERAQSRAAQHPGQRIRNLAGVLPRQPHRPFRHGAMGPAHGRHQGRGGEVLFEQHDCEIPATWSQLATNVVANKYFYGEVNTAEREKSVRQLDPSRLPHHRRLGPGGRLFRHARRTASTSTATWPGSACTSTRRSIRRSGSTWACTTSTACKGAMCNWHWDAPADDGRAAGEPLRISPGLGLLHPERAGQHGRHHGAGPQRGHALQVRLGHGHRPLHAAVRIARSSPAAASPRGRCRSCGSTTRLRRWSRAAARPAGPPRCSR